MARKNKTYEEMRAKALHQIDLWFDAFIESVNKNDENLADYYFNFVSGISYAMSGMELISRKEKEAIFRAMFVARHGEEAYKDMEHYI